MISCRRRLSVASRVEDAFEYVADWKNFQSWLPMFSNLEPTSFVQYGPGTSLDATIALGKLQLRTTLDVTEFAKNRRLVIKATKGVRLRLEWEFKDLGGRVLITFGFEYDLPSGLAFRSDQKDALEKELEEAACRSTELLRWVLEHRPRSDADH
ncbi:MAG: SRPBCC family protein [Methanobacteriota archaeon]|nr:MAG: SRPBCC family protein [Euryarchaeota archaeon]